MECDAGDGLDSEICIMCIIATLSCYTHCHLTDARPGCSRGFITAPAPLTVPFLRGDSSSFAFSLLGIQSPTLHFIEHFLSLLTWTWVSVECVSVFFNRHHHHHHQLQHQQHSHSIAVSLLDWGSVDAIDGTVRLITCSRRYVSHNGNSDTHTIHSLALRGSPSFPLLALSCRLSQYICT